MNLWKLVGLLFVLATFAGTVWCLLTWPTPTAVAIAILGALVIASVRRDYLRARRPSPFGGASDRGPEICPHCYHRIEADDAVRAVVGHVPMHERCARERQAVQS